MGPEDTTAKSPFALIAKTEIGLQGYATFTHEWTKDGGRTEFTFFIKILVVEIAIPFW